jgi:PAS domain S-box-containing protein
MFSHIFYSYPIAITLTNLSTGDYVDVNAAAERLLGYDRDELLAQLNSDLRLAFQHSSGFARATVALTQANGETRVVDVRAFTVNIRNEPHYLPRYTTLRQRSRLNRRSAGPTRSSRRRRGPKTSSWRT